MSEHKSTTRYAGTSGSGCSAMSDAQFTRLLRRAAKAMNRARSLVESAEAEYERRYGVHPSDADDDHWIDSMTGSSGACNDAMTAGDVEKGAVNYAGLKPYMANASNQGQRAPERTK